MARYRQGWSRGWKKSARRTTGEWYDSGWELQYMDELDRDPLVVRWTRHHGLRIWYQKWWGGVGKYEPDFLVELSGGDKELREVKGEHLFADRNTVRKLNAGHRFCRDRGMTFRVITKGGVDPGLWAPEPRVLLEESSPSRRPEFGDDAHTGRPSGCLASAGTLALFVIVIYLLLRW